MGLTLREAIKGIEPLSDDVAGGAAINLVGDPVDVLAKVGGLEIGGIAGIILGAAYYKVPVAVDGFISSAGALVALRLGEGTGAALAMNLVEASAQVIGRMLTFEDAGVSRDTAGVKE